MIPITGFLFGTALSQASELEFYVFDTSFEEGWENDFSPKKMKLAGFYIEVRDLSSFFASIDWNAVPPGLSYLDYNAGGAVDEGERSGTDPSSLHSFSRLYGL